MGFSKTYSAHISVLEAHIVDIEVDLSVGLYYFSIIGLPDKGVEEARDRIGAAIKNSGYTSPKQKNHKVVISLAPANTRKEGPIFDVAMAIAYLLAAKEIEFNPEETLFLGELSLDGKIRPIQGALPLVLKAEKQGFKKVFVPKENAEEGALAQNIEIYGAATLREVILHINKKELDQNTACEAYEEYQKDGVQKFEAKKIKRQSLTKTIVTKREDVINFSLIKGQTIPKRVLEIAAAGKHNVMLYGPPGTGKTMLAKAFSSILPRLTFDEMIECTCIHSASGKKSSQYIVSPPFRSPHHTASYVSLVGGGSLLKPGEATLAHRGVLFADEFPEFNTVALEALREPLESKNITISRAKGTLVLPADFILIATMNPCPCGYRGYEKKKCSCRAADIARYRRKLSGPIIDRIDLWTNVHEVNYKTLSETVAEENSEIILKRVVEARRKRKERINNYTGMHVDEIDSAFISKEALVILENAAKKFTLSARSFLKTMSVGRTIADIEGSKNIEAPHILEALQYRPKDFLL